MKRFQLTSFFIFFVIVSLFAQDTSIYETTFSEGEKLGYFKQEKKVSDKLIEEIMVQNGQVWITTYNYSKDTEFRTRLILKPNLLNGLSEGDFIIPASSMPDTTFFSDNNAIYPCPCLTNSYPIQFFKIQKVFSCQLDTFRLEKYAVIFKKDSLLRKTYIVKNGKHLLVDKEYYDIKGRRIREESLCDTSSVQYDSLDRKFTEEFIYHCDNFRYKLFYKYEKNIQLVFGVDNGKTHLTEKIIKDDSNKFKKIVYYSDSIYTETIYKTEDKPLNEKKFKKGKATEIYDWEYNFDKSSNTELIIKKMNGTEISRTMKRKK
jgi:hypothetical protein